MNTVGFGVGRPKLAVYIANRPVNDHYPRLNVLQPLAPGELQSIVANNSNHWRKAFNVLAKVLWQLNWPEVTGNAASTWQDYRDQHLLQAHSEEALLFSPPVFSCRACLSVPGNSAKPSLDQNRWHVVAGKTYAAALDLPPLTWLDAYFAINKECQLIVSPYLDYRQLSNERIKILADQLKFTPDAE